jgi:hypothetical protein
MNTTNKQKLSGINSRNNKTLNKLKENKMMEGFDTTNVINFSDDYTQTIGPY